MGEQAMRKSMDCVGESTNAAKNKTKISKMILILSYLIIWAVSILLFWFTSAADDAMGYSLIFLWGILPVTTFVISLLISKNNYWGNRKWIGSIGFGIMYMLAEYATFSMANNVTFNRVNVPEFGMIIAGAIVSLIGMGIGHAAYTRKETKRKN